MKKLILAAACIILVLVGMVIYKRLYIDMESGREIVEITIANQVATTDISAATIEEIIGGLTKPWDVAVMDDGTILITEDEGTISRVQAGQKEVLQRVANVNAQGEGGLMGMTLDGEFAAHPYVYACYATDDDIRVSRWKWHEGELSEQIDIVTGMPVNRSTFPGRHSGCRPRFGPDGYLWIGTGDVAIGTNPQDPSSLGGKVLRVDRDGQAALDNPNRDLDARIYSYGHRNIQGIAFRQGDSDFIGVSVEHGSDTDDEVNELVRGGNFGWNPVPGYNENVPMTDSEAYPGAVQALWSTGKPTLAPSGATFLYGSQWGQYDGVLLVAMLKTQHIRALSLTDEGRVQGEEEWFKRTYGRIRTVVQAPDGSLYFTTDNGGAKDVVVRVTPSP